MSSIGLQITSTNYSKCLHTAVSLRVLCRDLEPQEFSITNCPSSQSDPTSNTNKETEGNDMSNSLKGFVHKLKPSPKSPRNSLGSIGPPALPRVFLDDKLQGFMEIGLLKMGSKPLDGYCDDCREKRISWKGDRRSRSELGNVL